MDKIDFTNAIATAKNFAASLPSSKPHRIMLMKKIAGTIQEKQGHFFFDQVYEILERTYPEIVVQQKSVVEEIENWVDKDEEVEFLGEDSGFCAYRLR